VGALWWSCQGFLEGGVPLLREDVLHAWCASAVEEYAALKAKEYGMDSGDVIEVRVTACDKEPMDAVFSVEVTQEWRAIAKQVRATPTDPPRDAPKEEMP
jgi:hypothetical protein